MIRVKIVIVIESAWCPSLIFRDNFGFTFGGTHPFNHIFMPEQR